MDTLKPVNVSPLSVAKIVINAKVTLTRVPHGNRRVCTELIANTTRIGFVNSRKEPVYWYLWNELKSILFVSDLKARFKFRPNNNPRTLEFWCKFASVQESKACRNAAIDSEFINECQQIGKLDRLRFKEARKYVPHQVVSAPPQHEISFIRNVSKASTPVSSGLSSYELQCNLNNTSSFINQSTQSIANKSIIEPEFMPINPILEKIDAPVKPLIKKQVTQTDLDDIMCFNIFGFNVPTEYYQVVMKKFEQKYGLPRVEEEANESTTNNSVEEDTYANESDACLIVST